MPSEIEELRDRVAKLERQMEDMAEVVAAVIESVLGDDFDRDCWAKLDWEDYLIPGEDLESGADELCGWWSYSANVEARKRAETRFAKLSTPDSDRGGRDA